MIRIIGIGSPCGDDAVGLEVARILAQAPPPNCEVIVADRPGTNLIELLDDIEDAILVDAVDPGRLPAPSMNWVSMDSPGLPPVSLRRTNWASQRRFSLRAN